MCVRLHPRNVGYLCSPYRKPLARFLNRFSAESLRYFLAPAHLSSPTIAALFQCVLKDVKESAGLRTALMNDAQLPPTESLFISRVFAAQVQTVAPVAPLVACVCVCVCVCVCLSCPRL